MAVYVSSADILGAKYKKTVGGRRSRVPEILGQNDPPPSKTISNRYSLVAPSEKSLIVTNRKSTAGFPMSLS